MRYLHELPRDNGIEEVTGAGGCPVILNGKNRVNILALGDVGTTMLIGLRLLGSDVILRSGSWIYALRTSSVLRWRSIRSDILLA